MNMSIELINSSIQSPTKVRRKYMYVFFKCFKEKTHKTHKTLDFLLVYN